MKRLSVALLLGLAALTASAFAAAPALASPDVRVTVGSPTGPFPRNKQNEPADAIDAHMPNVVAAGANEEIDVQPCPTTAPSDPNVARCPFTQGVGTSGIYFSFDGGQTWMQPTYTGYTARRCTPTACTLGDLSTPASTGVAGFGPIGTLPWYAENGLVSDGDPSLAFGPAPGPNGHINKQQPWANGSRLYYANLTANFATTHSDQAFKGFEAIAVSHIDNPSSAARVQNKNNWSQPVIVSKQNAALFSDKEDVWADNAASSPYFGNVYLCNAAFRGIENGNGAPEPVVFSRSTDAGVTWSNPQPLSQAANNTSNTGRQGCTVRTDSNGIVYVFWIGFDTNSKSDVQFMARSLDGGQKFESPRIVATVVDVGAFDPTQDDISFDGVGGARTDSFPSVDIANGAPSGQDATNEIVLSWADARNATPSPASCCPGEIGPGEEALVQYSTDRGLTWSQPVNAARAGDRPDFPAVGISPDGADVYVVYDAFAFPWLPFTSLVRPMAAVVRHASATLTGWTTLHVGAVGDARGSSANALDSEFIGDYNWVSAMRTPDPAGMQVASGMPPEFAVPVWNDTRNASHCTTIDNYREALFLFDINFTTTEPTAPYPGSPNCPFTFGNSDIFGGRYTPTSTP